MFDIMLQKGFFMIKRVVLALAILSLLTSCVGMKPKKEESAFIVLKTPTIRYADMGFVTASPTAVKVEIYGAGQPLMKLEIGGLNICMSKFKCMDKMTFNEKVLNGAYDKNLLENIFRGEPIFKSENIESDKDGSFSQKLTKENVYDISYRVNQKERVFRDKLNKILIKVREQK